MNKPNKRGLTVSLFATVNMIFTQNILIMSEIDEFRLSI